MEEQKGENTQQQQISRHERRMLRHANKESIALEQSNKVKSEKSAKNLKKFSIVAGVAVVLIAAISIWVISFSNSPGPYDKFAKCLSDKGAVIYGADWCRYTAEQKAMFGKSFKYLNYEDFSRGEDISVTPTWVIDGEKYEKVQSFERLASITGCAII